MNIDKYPLKALEDLEFLLNDIRAELTDNAKFIVEFDSNSDNIIEIKSSKFEVFTFVISDFKLMKYQGGLIQTEFNHLFKPKSSTDEGVNKANNTKKTTKENFIQWLELIKRYHLIDFFDPIIEQYEEEIYEYIKIYDDDADTEPFAIEQQVLRKHPPKYIL